MSSLSVAFILLLKDLGEEKAWTIETLVWEFIPSKFERLMKQVDKIRELLKALVVVAHFCIFTYDVPIGLAVIAARFSR